MFSRLLFPAFLLSMSFAFSQADYPAQPSAGYYEDLKKLALPVVPTQQQMMAAKAEIIPAGFKDTLLKYDWYEIANYYFYDKTYSSFSDDLGNREKVQASNQFNFFRYTQTGIKYEMSLHRYKDASVKVKTTTFDENNAAKLLEVKKVAAKNMMVTGVFGEKEMQELLSYRNGVLIVNIKQAPNATTKRFHTAYLAVPKTF